MTTEQEKIDELKAEIRRSMDKFTVNKIRNKMKKNEPLDDLEKEFVKLKTLEYVRNGN